MFDSPPTIWHVAATAGTLAVSILASAHVVLYKRDSRSAVGWVGVIWLAPLLGAVLYLLFGINRIRRRAAARRTFPAGVPTGALPSRGEAGGPPERRRPLRRVVDRVARRPLTPGNSIRPLVDGEEAYPAMIAAIEGAGRSVALSTYIFDNDSAGALFLGTLAAAVRRGVSVRVLVDAAGARYSWPPILGDLRRHGVPAAAFGRTLLPWRMPYMNLRNHRKILVVDGAVGFTGGMNIREGHLVGTRPRHPVRDLHFELRGPVVGHLAETFAEDWMFTTRETLPPEFTSASREAAGPVFARGLSDGPDEDFEVAYTVLLGAIACARRSIRIITPYFLPDSGLMQALRVAALRGVEVEILIPERCNLRLVGWAAMAQLWQVVKGECRVWLTPPPFDHSKAMVVDDEWTLFGSSNWDARSLRLNFELDVEAYDDELAGRVSALLDVKRRGARRVTAEDLDGRPLPVRLRNGVARLAAPYL